MSGITRPSFSAAILGGNQFNSGVASTARPKTFQGVSGQPPSTQQTNSYLPAAATFSSYKAPVAQPLQSFAGTTTFSPSAAGTALRTAIKGFLDGENSGGSGHSRQG